MLQASCIDSSIGTISSRNSNNHNKVIAYLFSYFNKNYKILFVMWDEVEEYMRQTIACHHIAVETGCLAQMYAFRILFNIFRFNFPLNQIGLYLVHYNIKVQFSAFHSYYLCASIESGSRASICSNSILGKEFFSLFLLLSCG